MIINGIDFEVVVNVRKTKSISVKIKTKDLKHYLCISSYKKLKEKDVLNLLSKHKDIIDKLISKMVINPLKEDELLILGTIYKRNAITTDIINNAYERIFKMFNSYKTIFNKPYVTLIYKKMSTRWGVCYLRKDKISLTKNIVSLPLYLIEYIIIHEFCHFTYPNHSKEFYGLVMQYCPKYKIFKKELKSFSYVLN